MIEEPDSTIGPGSWKDIEGRLEAFEEAWKRALRDAKASPPRIEDYLVGVAPHRREELLRELLRLDIAYRRKQGSSRTAAEYVAEFPEDRDLIEDVCASALDEQPLPDQIGRYRIISQLSHGGQAVVYRAVHPTLDQELVLKLGKRTVAADARRRNDLAAEGRLLADLQHPHLARVYDLDFDQDRPFLVLEFIRGPNLAQFTAERPVAPRQAAALVSKLAGALAEAHQRGVIHRDLKPRNVVMDESGEPRVIDFGLARLQDAWTDEEDPDGMISGTPSFMAPEQARGETDRIGAASDIFALGGILYFLLTGQVPFPGQNVAEQLKRARECNWDQTALEKPGIPTALARICRRAMQAEPSDRYAAAEDVGCALDRFLRRRVLFGTVAAVAAGILAVVTALLAGHDSEAPVAARAQPELEVLVWRGERVYPLSEVLPLQTGDRLQVRGELPGDLPASLLWLDSEGRLHDQVMRRNDGDRQRFVSPGPHKWTPLEGPPGTEFILLCGGRWPQASAAALQDLIGSNGAWPKLRNGTWIVFDGTHAEMKTSRPRAPGQPVRGPDPDVLERAEALCQALVKEYELVVGIGFSHAEPSEFNQAAGPPKPD